jgi:hypothetical protein
MVAAPFKASLLVAKGSVNGPRKIFSITGSDVAAEYLLFDSGSSEVTLSGDADVFIVDVIYSAAGTDTSNDQVFIGGVTDGTKIYRATSLATTIQRPYQIAPLKIPKGTSVKFKQLA